MTPFVTSVLYGTLAGLAQVVAALPWLAVLDPRTFRKAARQPANWLIVAGVGLGIGVLIALMIGGQDKDKVLAWGRAFGGVLQAQLAVDFFVLLWPLLMLLWPQGAAVGLAAFREGIRQPMFWLIMGFALLAFVISPFLPYFTFGEDWKMVHELGFDITMLCGVLFGVLASSMSITEEIEGRTAITVMSKPVSRRQFLVGKFVGIFLAVMFMTAILSWVFNGVMWFEIWFDKAEVAQPSWLEPARQSVAGHPSDSIMNFLLGGGVWFEGLWDKKEGLIFGLCQSMVILAIAVALATRLPFIVTFVSCVVVFFLGHLTHILVRTNQDNTLISFTAKVFDTILPGLEHFDLGQVVVRDLKPDPAQLGIYVVSVALYAVLYSIIALLFGLVLFEDRDLA